MQVKTVGIVVFSILCSSGLLCAADGGESTAAAATTQTISQVSSQAGAPATSQAALIEPSYTLQSLDEITVRSLNVKELADKIFRLDARGEANFPLVGRLELAGKTATEIEQLLIEKLKRFYLEPELELSVASLHTEPVSVIGAVGTPGIRDMKGKMTLLDALSASGGVRTDAGPIAVVTRAAPYGAIGYPDSRITPSGESVAEVDLKRLMDAQDPKDNFILKPHDVVSVPVAQLVYVQGNVKHPGGFPLGGKAGLSVLQALALAEGLDPRAAPQRAHILRHVGETKQLIPVDLKLLLAGKREDLTLKPNDILFVPNSTMKVITTRSVEAAISIGTGILVFH